MGQSAAETAIGRGIIPPQDGYGVDELLQGPRIYAPEEARSFYKQVLQGLHAGDPSVQGQAEGVLQQLRKFAPEETIANTIKAFENPDESVQGKAFRELNKQTRGKTYLILHNAHIDATDPDTRIAIAKGLASVDERWALTSLVHMLHDPDSGVSAAATESLDELFSPFRLGETQDEFEEDKDKQTSVGHLNTDAINRLREAFLRGKDLPPELLAHNLGDEQHHLDERKIIFKDLSKFALHGLVSSEALQEQADISVIRQTLTGEWKKIPWLVPKIVQRMNERFEDSLKLEPTGKRIGIAFTENIDSFCVLHNNEQTQAIIDKAVEDAIAEGEAFGQSKNEVIAEIEGIINEPDPDKVPSKLSREAEVLGCILRVFTEKGLKSLIVDQTGVPGSGKKLADWVGETFNHEYDAVGGGAANMSSLLARLGEENVFIYSRFHAERQARAYIHPPRFLGRGRGKFPYMLANDEQSIGKDDPIKINYAVEIQVGASIVFNEHPFTAQRADRQIFKTEYYDDKGNIVPFEPGFDLSPTEFQEMLDNTDRLVVNGIQDVQKSTDIENYKRISSHLREQLLAIRNAGIVTHVEFSGGTRRPENGPEWSGIRYLQDVLRGTIQSMGIGDEELRPVLLSIRNELGESSIQVIEGGTPFALYQNALTLAQYLGLDRLYVHGVPFDLALIQNIDETSVKPGEKTPQEQEIEAMLHAKLRVIQSLENIPPGDIRLSAVLKREGFVAYMDVIEQLAETVKGDNRQKFHFMRDFAVKGYARSPQDPNYTVIVTPVKWIYNQKRVVHTTGSGDITSVVAFAHSSLS